MIIPERINLLIEFIRQSGKIYMEAWQVGEGGLVRAAEEFHACGNRACIAGHLALLPEFQAIGGQASIYDGEPYLISKRLGGAGAVCWWLAGEKLDYVTDPLARKIRLIIVGVAHRLNRERDALILSRWSDWGTEQAIKALEILRDQPDLTLEEFHEALEAL